MCVLLTQFGDDRPGAADDGRSGRGLGSVFTVRILSVWSCISQQGKEAKTDYALRSPKFDCTPFFYPCA